MSLRGSLRAVSSKTAGWGELVRTAWLSQISAIETGRYAGYPPSLRQTN